VDIVDRATRSKMMSGIRGRNTRPELAVRQFLFSAGFRYRLHESSLPGKPDLVLPKYKSVVFVHGCFWHQHPHCRFAYMPKSRTSFWRAKLSGNARRDAKNRRMLKSQGWRVHVVWECQVAPRRLQRLAHAVRRSAREWQADLEESSGRVWV
jgi:DNA mismatch endonuclease (patch repair protein)